MSIQNLKAIRERMMPMLQGVAEQYQFRVPTNYPHIVDEVERGMIGVELDPSHSLYITAEGDDIFAEVYKRVSRTDTRSSSSRQKYAGVPFHDRRPFTPDPTDQELRNLIGELKQAFNYQPGLLYITDD